MIITFSGKINTYDAEEKEVFEAFKEFITDNFQNCEFEVSGEKDTFKHKIEKKDK